MKSDPYLQIILNQFMTMVFQYHKENPYERVPS